MPRLRKWKSLTLHTYCCLRANLKDCASSSSLFILILIIVCLLFNCLSFVPELMSHRHLSGDLDAKPMTNLSRSRSTQSLKHAQDPTGFDDRLTILAQIFWISVSMMESDFESEFLLAIRLLDKVRVYNFSGND